MQLDMFEGPLTESEMLRRDLKEVRDRCDNARRGLFRRYNDLCKRTIELINQLDQVKSRLDKLDDQKTWVPTDELPDFFQERDEKGNDDKTTGIAVSANGMVVCHTQSPATV